ncbi:SDR family NAD(P)-dependent oxidoreductase [Bermanella marisrubri]|uniref:Oxidoreductase, short-chain dehydrogenase/reductase family protein n=1 Tax=Bermanella marisrubri TaxID=207949 RepID=Q1MZC0_9GAMM|nr:SDR family NAD(P)-dependent oxidoreductase [Bermanella marisrubri]EAT11346.1 oxidoreductase, short-chain dehydrogenase/reductase family protein [Oceanobacter sp. RED65] [Bermanella marisrubri]QIZ85267.1 SDR family NAD(P)-dependent oxidoreductase [Bermanella marisrubri]
MTNLIIGASSEIAQSITRQLLSSGEVVHGISQHPQPAQVPHDQNLHWWICHYGESHIEQLVESLQETITEPISRVVICNGQLHGDGLVVEKRLQDLQESSFHQIINSNALVPLLWLRALLPWLSKQECKIAVFSARVGSIEDNKLGGWYSYRASKAALNMLLKTAAIEYSRRAKKIKLMAFHPGTTDTPLSKPFQANVAESKLFEPEFVAKRLLEIMESLHIDGELSYLDWAGEPIRW